MKKLLLLTSLLFCSLLAQSQIQQKWVARYNGTGNNIDQAKSIAVDVSGNVYVTGQSTGSGSGFDFATIKYNASGNQQWVQRYNGPGNSYDYIGKIVVDAQGNSYITGGSWGVTSRFDCATIKYNTAGQVQWTHRFNGSNGRNDISTAVVVDAAGNVYITGHTNYIYDDYLTVKYNSSGELQWYQTYNSLAFSDDYGYAIALDASGNVFVTGYSTGEVGGFNYVTIKYNSSGVEQWVQEYNGVGGGDDIAMSIHTDSEGNVIISGFTSEQSSSFDYTTIKYNSAGVQQWLQRYNGPLNGGEFGYSMVLDGSGNSIVTGSSMGTTTGTDYATVKYNPAGVQQWITRYNNQGTGFDAAYAIVTDAAGNSYVTGESNSTGSLQDYATLKYNSNGVQQWVQRYNGTGNSNDYGRAIAIDHAGNIYVTGESTGSGGSGLDYATIKYSPTTRIATAIESPDNFNLMENYPNPFNPVTVISYQLPVAGNTTVKIYDVLGNQIAVLVNEIQEAGTYAYQWDASGYPSGIYFYKLVTGGFTDTKKMNLIK